MTVSFIVGGNQRKTTYLLSFTATILGLAMVV